MNNHSRKIERVDVDSFLGLRNISIELGKLNLVAGDNWSGKSSLQQAMRVAAAGEVTRVKLKKNYSALIRDGAKQATVKLFFDDGTVNDVLITKTTGTTVVPKVENSIISMALDQQLFFTLSEGEMRNTLFEVDPSAFDALKVAKRMVELGANPELVAQITPLLSSNFDAAASEAEQELKELRANWKAISNEVYGSEKAEIWECSADVEALQKKAKTYARLADELNTLNQKIEAQQAVADRARVQYLTCTIDYKCKNCEHVNLHDDSDAAEFKVTYQKEIGALDFLNQTKSTVEYELKQADDAAKEIDIYVENANKKTEAAQSVHKKILDWLKIKELLGQDGVLAEIVADALAPINARLKYSESVSGLGLVQIHPDMTVTLDDRLYGLVSESQQWIAQAMICEAVSYVSGLGFITLDRIDVLGVTNRGKLLKWAGELCGDTQMILFGTLKSKPEISGVMSYWIENGEIAEG